MPFSSFSVKLDSPLLDMPCKCYYSSFAPDGTTPRRCQISRNPSELDPLYLAGRHFGRTMCCFVNISLLIRNYGGLNTLRSSSTFGSVLKMAQGSAPDILASIVRSSDAGIREVVEMLQSRAESALSEDIRTINALAPHWIASNDGLTHPYPPSGAAKQEDAWPLFVYDHREFDPAEAWKGLFKSPLLVTVYIRIIIHGPGSRLEQVTPGSIAYVATLIKLYLSKNPWHTRQQHIDFYNRIVDLLTSSENEDGREAEKLLRWWNCKVFPVGASMKYRDYSVRLTAAFIDATAAFEELFKTDVESESEG